MFTEVWWAGEIIMMDCLAILPLATCFSWSQCNTPTGQKEKINIVAKQCRELHYKLIDFKTNKHGIEQKRIESTPFLVIAAQSQWIIR